MIKHQVPLWLRYYTNPLSMTTDYQTERKKKVQQLNQLENIIEKTFKNSPNLISIKKGNQLIRTIWTRYGDYSAASILRVARKLRATGKYDNEDNQLERANIETAYRQYF